MKRSNKRISEMLGRIVVFSKTYPQHFAKSTIAGQAMAEIVAAVNALRSRYGYVFTTGWGEPIYPDTVTSLMTKLIRANQQLPHARLHDLRHLHATTLLLSGVPVHVVAARLGHADPAITLRVYAHVIRSAEAAAADIFAEAVMTAC